MTRVQAVELLALFILAIMVILSVCVVVMALRYEVQDRRRRRAHGGVVTIAPQPVQDLDVPALVVSLEMHRRYRANTTRPGSAA